MRRSLSLVILALAAGAGVAGEGDPLHSPECLRSLQALQAQEAAAIAARRAPAGEAARPRPGATLEKLQRQAAEACLGSRADAAPPAQRAVQPPVSVRPDAPPAAASARMPPVPAAAPPPVRIPPLRTVTACDATGCWTSDGQRLTRAGDMLFGAPGVCAVVAGVLSCH